MEALAVLVHHYASITRQTCGCQHHLEVIFMIEIPTAQ